MRQRDPEKLGAIAAAALRVFTRQGYQQTLMADVAREAGVAAGTLYLYVESKEALLELALEQAESGIVAERSLPMAGRGIERIAAGLRDRLEKTADWKVLKAALARRRAPDPGAEMRGIAAELYDFIAGARHLIWLLDRCAVELAPFAKVFHDRVKGAYLGDLAAYVRKRQPEVDATAAARLVMEMIVWMAAHRHRDALPPPIDEACARETAIVFAVKVLR
jgi:AcrR family transcriptional regulator